MNILITAASVNWIKIISNDDSIPKSFLFFVSVSLSLSLVIILKRFNLQSNDKCLGLRVRERVNTRTHQTKNKAISTNEFNNNFPIYIYCDQFLRERITTTKNTHKKSPHLLCWTSFICNALTFKKMWEKYLQFVHIIEYSMTGGGGGGRDLKWRLKWANKYDIIVL